jgi:hypothetical protein
MPARPRTYLANKGLEAKRALLWQIPGERLRHKTTPPIYRCWSHFLAKTSHAERMKKSRMKAKKANAVRLLSEAPEISVTAQEVWAIQEASEGRCFHCGSLAVEGRPSKPKTGAPLPWAQIGRRIGALDHLTTRFEGGGNDAGISFDLAFGATHGRKSGAGSRPTMAGIVRAASA